MNLYGLDYSLLDVSFDDPTLIESFSSSHQMYSDRRHREREEDILLKLSSSILIDSKTDSSTPKRRHDGTSPLPLGMDWSPPPRNWDGPSTIWPHDFQTGWSYCVTVPSCSIFSESGGSEPVTFYRVQVGLQSPLGVTTTRGVLRRFSDFLKLSSDLKQSFPKKKVPPAPPKGLLRMKSRALLDERRCALEDWMAKVLPDMDFSRSVPVACFLELEASARSSFSESSHHAPDVNLRCNSGSSSDQFSTYETSEFGSALCVKDSGSEIDKGNPNNDLAKLTEATVSEASHEKNNTTLFEAKEEKDSRKLFDERINSNKIHDSIENYPVKNSPMIGDAKGLLRESHQKGASPATLVKISNLSEVHQDFGGSFNSSESVEASGALDTLASSDLQFPNDALVFLPMEEQQKINRFFTTMQQRFVTSKMDIEDLIARLDQELASRQYLTAKVKDLETELESTKSSGKENLKQAIFMETERFTQLQWDMEELGKKYIEMEDKKTSLTKENKALQQELDTSREQLKNFQKFHEEADLKSKSHIKLLAREVKSLRNSQFELQQELDRVAKERTELEAQLLAQDSTTLVMSLSNESDSVTITDDESMKMVRDVVTDNDILRKGANSAMRSDLNMTDAIPDSSGTFKDDDDPPRKEL